MPGEGSIRDAFAETAGRFADCPALLGDGRAWTYRELQQRVEAVASAITRLTPPGNHCVAVLAEHSPEMVIATLAVVVAGKMSLGLHPQLPEAAQCAIMTDAAPVLVLTTAGCAPRARAVAGPASAAVVVLDEVGEAEPVARPAPPVCAADLATIVYTSGTTGQPKGVLRSHRAIQHRVAQAVEYDGIGVGDRVSLLSHASSGASQVDLFGALLSGATLCVFDVSAQGLSAFNAWLDEQRITVLHPPTLLFRRFLAALGAVEPALPLERQNLFPSVRLVALAGDVVLPADLALWQRRFSPACALVVRFSTTEAGLLTQARFDRDTDVHGADALAGWPVAGKTLQIVDDDGTPQPPGVEGTLVVTSDMLADGYWRRPDETAAAFRPAAVPGQRRYATGDWGSLLPDGRFVFVGRRDHQVKIRGYRVDVREVEAALASLPGVREAAVVACGDASERRLCAFVVTEPDRPMDASALRAHLGARLPPWTIPARWVAIDALPIMLAGKIDRPRLEALAEQPTAAALPPAQNLEEELAALWGAVLRVPRIGMDETFVAAGGDSIAAMTVLVHIEQRYGARLRPADLIDARTVRDLAAAIRGLTEDAGAAIAADDGRMIGPMPAGRAPVVPMGPKGTKPPFFFLHGWGGSVLSLLDLARALGPDQPAYGLQAVGSDGTLRRAASLEEIAAHHVQHLRAMDPGGPYYLGGYSAGGLVAFEVARQLVASGGTVGLLALLDTTPNNLPWPLFLKVHVRHWLARIAYHVGVMASGKSDNPWRYLAARLETVRRTLRGERPHKAAANDPFVALAGRYRPGSFSGPAVLVVAASEKKDLVSAWRHLIPQGLRVEEVSGTHDTMLDAEHVDELAAALRRRLAVAHAGDPRVR
ncbi:MAG: AMP-binding protein [Candidatus Binatia bacterium]